MQLTSDHEPDNPSSNSNPNSNVVGFDPRARETPGAQRRARSAARQDPATRPVRVQVRLPLRSLAETEQHLQLLHQAIEHCQVTCKRARRSREHGDALDTVRVTLTRVNRLINAKHD